MRDQRPTPTQEASRELADQVAENPELRRRFETMAADMASREPVRDDFSWLKESDARFQEFAEKLVAVPKSETNAQQRRGVTKSN